MSSSTTLSEIENLSVDQLAEALEFNGYGGECVMAIRTKSIDGQEFLKLTELQISLWRLPPIQARRLRSFIQQVNQDPKQFLINFKTSNKMAPKVSTLNRSIKINNNSPTTSNLLPNQPNVSPKPNISNHFQNSLHMSENTSVKRKEINSSTLTKQESQLFKHRLAQILKADCAETSSSNNQSQPPIPPKPSNLKVAVINKYNEFEENPDDFNDGYLSPIKVDPNKHESAKLENAPKQATTILRSNSTGSSSFLYKFRKNYEHLESRPGVVENNYEEQNAKPQKVQGRPLPPIPAEKENEEDLPLDIEFETDDEGLAEYTPVIENENTEINVKDIRNAPKPNSFRRASLPTNHFKKTLESDDEELAEYAKVLEDDDTDTTSNNIKYTATLSIHSSKENPVFSRPLPAISDVSPLVTSSTSHHSRLNLRPQLPTPNLDQEQLSKSRLNTGIFKTTTSLKPTGKTVKPRAELPKLAHTLPKPPNNLPKPPFKLPDSPSFVVISQNDIPSIEFDVASKPQQRPLPALPTQKSVEKPTEQNVTNIVEDELAIYSEIDLAMEPNYRETDRKGARRLLSGLADGAYVIRPSRKDNYICTFSIMHKARMFNLGIEKNADGTFMFGSVASDFDQPKLCSVRNIIKYYSGNPLYLSGESIILKDILPRYRQ